MDLRRVPLLAISMALAVLAVTALAYWDQQREAALALAEFAEEQATLAAGIASATAVRLAQAPAADARVLEPLAGLERDRQRALLVLPPGGAAFTTLAGRALDAPELRAALAAGATAVRLDRPRARALGLAERTAVAGLARAAGWGFAVVTTASRERDRARQATMRLLLSTLLAGGLVLAFGGLALRERRKELEVSRSLAAEQLAREREMRLERESRAATVITLASGVAHEIATPLGVIVGRAEQLEGRVKSDERATRAVQAILEQAEGIREVIRGFLSLARGTAPALTSVAPAEIAQRALGLVAHRFQSAGVSVASSVAETLPPIDCDPRLLGHALVNLLLNACDACARGGHVELRAHALAETVAFEVADDGEGISEAVVARATEPFFTTKAEGKGTGLGLAIANEIVKTHRGSLHISRAASGGTLVSVSIPRAREGHA